MPFVFPLFWHNLKTFGTFTRTGYSYWCASIYDVPGVIFRFDLATLKEGLGFYYVPFGLNMFNLSGLSLLALVAVAGYVTIRFLRAWRDAPSLRHYAVFTLATFGAFQLLYLPYTFRFHWFAYPAYVCLVPFLADGLGCLWPGTAFGLKAMRWRAGCLAVILLLCLSKRWCIPLGPDDPRIWAWAEYHRLKRFLPDDAVFISARDALGVHEELVRDTRRVFVPLNRSTPYANLQLTPRPPSAHTTTAVAAASRPVYPFVFDEGPATFLLNHLGRRVILETKEPDAFTPILPPGFQLVPFETRFNLGLYELKPL
jgi:hypothetical protein